MKHRRGKASAVRKKEYILGNGTVFWDRAASCFSVIAGSSDGYDKTLQFSILSLAYFAELWYKKEYRSIIGLLFGNEMRSAFMHHETT